MNSRIISILRKIKLAIFSDNYWKDEWDEEVKEKGLQMAQLDCVRCPASYERMQINIQKYLDLNTDDVFLDLGCGPGHILKKVIPFVSKAVGIDLSPQMIELAKQYLGNEKNIELYVGSMTQIPMQDDYFTKILCCSSIHYLSSKEMMSVKTEFNRILKKNGVIIITEVPQKGYHHKYIGFNSKKYYPNELIGLFDSLFHAEILFEDDKIFDLKLIKK